MMLRQRLSLRISLFVIAALAVFPGIGLAQMNFSAGLNFNIGFPKGELNEQIETNAYGLNGEVFYAPSQSPLAIGINAGWMNYGSESRRERFSTTIPDVTVEVSTTNNIVQFFGVLRGQMPKGPIQLYGDALVGFNYLYTETKITDADNASEEVASSTNQSDFTFAYGFGGGVMVPVFNRLGTASPVQVSIDAGAKYILGGNAEYLKKGSIRRENGEVIYDLIESHTDILRMQVGVAVRF